MHKNAEQQFWQKDGRNMGLLGSFRRFNKRNLSFLSINHIVVETIGKLKRSQFCLLSFMWKIYRLARGDTPLNVW